MSDPAWQQQPYEVGSGFTYPNFQTFVSTSGSNAQINVPSGIIGNVYAEFDVITLPGGQCCLGVITAAYAGPNVRQNYDSGSTAQSAWVAENGAVFTGAGYAGFSMSSLSSGSRLGFYVNTALTGIAFTQNGTVWNGSYTIAQILAGTGLVAINPGDAWGLMYSFASLTSGGGEVAIYASAANCEFALPPGASYLPANSILQIESPPVVDTTDLPVFAWGMGNVETSLVGSLLVSVDGSAFVVCNGTITGEGGNATLTTTLSEGIHTLTLQDSGNTSNESEPNPVYSFDKPSGAGSLVASYFGESVGTNPTITLTLAGGPYNKIYYNYGIYLDTGTTGTGALDVFDAASSEVSNANFSRYELKPLGVSSDSPLSGPNDYTGAAPLLSVFGTLDATQIVGTSAYGTATGASNNATSSLTPTQWGSTGTPLSWSDTPGSTFESLTLSVESLFGNRGIALAIWATPEILDHGLLCIQTGM